MQPQPDYLSVPRRQLDVEDYIDILRRHWMWIVGPTFLGLVISVVTAFLWPDTYVSKAIMRITPPQVPERVVPTNFNLDLRDRLQTMRQDVTSRGRLIEMIKKFGLYPKEQEKRPLEDIVEDMRRDIDIQPIDIVGGDRERGSSAFMVSFAYRDRKAAQDVVNETIGAFTSQNVVDRRQKSRVTSEFLSEELKTAKSELDKIESELTAFKMKNAGSLPEELTSNLQLQRSYEMQLQGVQDALNRDQQDRLILETQVENLKSQIDALVTTDVQENVQANERLLESERQVAEIEARFALMQERYRPGHPDLSAMQKRLETARAERDQLAAIEERVGKKKAPVKRIINPEALERKTQLESQMASAQAKIQAVIMGQEDRLKFQKQLRASLDSINSRIQANPLMQGEYARLTRDYNLAKEKYDRMNLQKNQADVANRLEDRSAGENLEVLDTASLPMKPSKPNRMMIISVGSALGLALGLFLAGAREVKDTTMKGLKDVRAYTELPILSSIPLLENAALIRRKRRLTWLAWSSATIVGILAMSSSAYYYYWGR